MCAYLMHPYSSHSFASIWKKICRNHQFSGRLVTAIEQISISRTSAVWSAAWSTIRFPNWLASEYIYCWFSERDAHNQPHSTISHYADMDSTAVSVSWNQCAKHQKIFHKAAASCSNCSRWFSRKWCCKFKIALDIIQLTPYSNSSLTFTLNHTHTNTDFPPNHASQKMYLSANRFSGDANVDVKDSLSDGRVLQGDEKLYPYLVSDDCGELYRHCPLSLQNVSPYTDDWARGRFSYILQWTFCSLCWIVFFQCWDGKLIRKFHKFESFFGVHLVNFNKSTTFHKAQVSMEWSMKTKAYQALTTWFFYCYEIINSFEIRKDLLTIFSSRFKVWLSNRIIDKQNLIRTNRE